MGLSLQEIDFTDAFDGIICVDAMEFVAPEDWPFVLNNFHRALKRNGYLYFTVELIEPEERAHAYSEGQKQGLPVVEGEYAHNLSAHSSLPLQGDTTNHQVETCVCPIDLSAICVPIVRESL
jgi:SAM-dependent methyltransferase